MKKMMSKFWSNEKGFTLIELIIVIAILAIISAIAIPNSLAAVDNSRRTTDVSNAKVIANAVATIKTQVDGYASAAGTFTFNPTAATPAIDYTSGSGDNPTANSVVFNAALLAQLSNNVLTPKFRGTNSADGQFMVTISNTGTPITVTVIDSGADDAILYPTVDTDYQNK